MSKRVIITGANGQLGKSILKISKEFPELEFFMLGYSDCDISEGQQVRKVFREINPDYLVNAAAYTRVDKAEEEAEQAMAVNGYALQNLGQVMKGRKVIHVSSDYVYHLDQRIPYKEDMELNPQNIYAKSKAVGESILKRTPCDWIIIRTSWVYSEFGMNFVKTMLKLAETMDEIKVVDDQWGSPTYATDLAQMILDLIIKDSGMVLSSDSWNQVYNYSNRGVINWFLFAKEIMKIAGLNTEITPIPTALFPRPASRPPWGALDMGKIQSKLKSEISDWKVSLEKCIDILIN